jgi:hypothetical protein
VDLHIFHTNAYWTCFCIKCIQSFGEEVLGVVAKGVGEGGRVYHALWEDNGYHVGLNCPGSQGRGIGSWFKMEELTFKKTYRAPG